MPLYPWEIPAVMSARCLIRVSDAANPSYYKTSEIFHIKPYYLTRYAADSTYELYLPSTQGWQYQNQESFLWPPSWWSQFDYQNGTDPYTDREYPSFDPAFPFALMPSEYFPDWPLMVTTFSESQCYFHTPTGAYYRMLSLYAWDDLADVWGGSCEGLANTSLLTFGSRELLSPRWANVSLPQEIHQASINDDIRLFINSLHTSQYGEAQYSSFSGKDTITVVQALEEIKTMLLQNKRDDAKLFIGAQTGSGSHAVVPYAIVPDPNASKVRVRIYDPNEPGNDALYIIVDTVDNSWWYSEYAHWWGKCNFYLDYPVRSCLDYPILSKSQSNSESAPVALMPMTGYMRMIYRKGTPVCITNPAGDSIGYKSEVVFNSISDAIPLTARQGDSTPPYGFLVPEESYDVTMTGFADGLAHFSLLSDSSFTSYHRTDADSTQTDRVTINGGLFLRNPDSTVKTVQLRMVQTLPEKERALVLSDF
ncbi:MAG: hypothetical protein U9Q77_13690, partial [Candidatus Marinimicrobia bacterium]|nr:hypothetical protein [Candidatus Neomarinimicrobiota bacterium]